MCQFAAIAREAKVSYRTLQYWLERYRTSGLAALARKPRIDRGRRRKLSAALQEAIEGLALKKPPLSITVVCNQAKLLADRLGEEASTYDLVYDVVSQLPADLVTLAHQGAIAYGDSFVSVRPRDQGHGVRRPRLHSTKRKRYRGIVRHFNSRSRIAKRIAFLFVLKRTLLSRNVDLFEGTEPARIGALGTAVAICRKGRKKN